VGTPPDAYENPSYVADSKAVNVELFVFSGLVFFRLVDVAPLGTIAIPISIWIIFLTEERTVGADLCESAKSVDK
jgi:hypothetical protein